MVKELFFVHQHVYLIFIYKCKLTLNVLKKATFLILEFYNFLCAFDVKIKVFIDQLWPPNFIYSIEKDKFLCTKNLRTVIKNEVEIYLTGQ